jgi:hypothetical protein
MKVDKGHMRKRQAKGNNKSDSIPHLQDSNSEDFDWGVIFNITSLRGKNTPASVSLQRSQKYLLFDINSILR